MCHKLLLSFVGLRVSFDLPVLIRVIFLLIGRMLNFKFAFGLCSTTTIQVVTSQSLKG